jgi:hypothetical protein
MKWHKTKLKRVPRFPSLWAEQTVIFYTEHSFALLNSFLPSRAYSFP